MHHEGCFRCSVSGLWIGILSCDPRTGIVINEPLQAVQEALHATDGMEINQVDQKEDEEEEDVSKIVYQDTPVVPAPWVSDTADETDREVQQLTVTSKRDPIILHIHRNTLELSKSYKFSDRDSDAGWLDRQRSGERSSDGLCRIS